MSIVNLIGSAVIVLIIFYLYKKGIIKNIRFPIIKQAFVSNHHKNGHVQLSYGKYNGVSTYPIFLNQSQATEFHYQIEVEEGSVELTIKIGKEVILNREFFHNDSGQITVSPKGSMALITVTGKHTRGNCYIEKKVVEKEKVEG